MQKTVFHAFRAVGYPEQLAVALRHLPPVSRPARPAAPRTLLRRGRGVSCAPARRVGSGIPRAPSRGRPPSNLTGRRPPTGCSSSSLVRLRTTVPRPLELRPGLDATWERLRHFSFNAQTGLGPWAKVAPSPAADGVGGPGMAPEPGARARQLPAPAPLLARRRPGRGRAGPCRGRRSAAPTQPPSGLSPGTTASPAAWGTCSPHPPIGIRRLRNLRVARHRACRWSARRTAPWPLLRRDDAGQARACWPPPPVRLVARSGPDATDVVPTSEPRPGAAGLRGAARRGVSSWCRSWTAPSVPRARATPSTSARSTTRRSMLNLAVLPSRDATGSSLLQAGSPSALVEQLPRAGQRPSTSARLRRSRSHRSPGEQPARLRAAAAGPRPRPGPQRHVLDLGPVALQPLGRGDHRHPAAGRSAGETRTVASPPTARSASPTRSPSSAAGRRATGRPTTPWC